MADGRSAIADQVQRREQINADCAALDYNGTLEANLHYDPTGRLYQINGGTYRFLYDGNALVAEYANDGTMLRRYAHSTNVEADDPLVWWEGSEMTCTGTRFMHADPRGSITALADCSGDRQIVNTYDGSEAERRRSLRTIWHPRHGHRRRHRDQGALPLYASSDNVRGTLRAAQPSVDP